MTIEKRLKVRSCPVKRIKIETGCAIIRSAIPFNRKSVIRFECQIVVYELTQIGIARGDAIIFLIVDFGFGCCGNDEFALPVA